MSVNKEGCLRTETIWISVLTWQRRHLVVSELQAASDAWTGQEVEGEWRVTPNVNEKKKFNSNLGNRKWDDPHSRLCFFRVFWLISR